MPIPNLASTHLSTGRSKRSNVDFTDRPEFDLIPNSKEVNALVMIAQIPHDRQVQNSGLFVPRSQIHFVLWNVRIWRGFPTAASLELGD